MNIKPKYPLMFLFIFLATIFAAKVYAGSIDTTTVKNVDIERYLGRWYEVARFPHSFEKGLERVTAEYSIRPDGKIRVVNSGFHPDGKPSRAEGKAYIPNPADSSRLKVSFFWFFYGDYFILELDEKNYNWALVGSNNDSFLWILSRTPEMDEKVYAELLEKAKKRGYDLSKLIKVKQK